MRQAKRCDCSFQQSGCAVAGERIRVNAASSCGRNSYTCQNRCQPKPCTPRPCEKVRRPNKCMPCGKREKCCGNDFESSYYRAMDQIHRCYGNDYDRCGDDWYDDCGMDWRCDDNCGRSGHGYDCHRRHDRDCGCRRPYGKDDFEPYDRR